jgi:hypothetical protein
LVTAAAGCTSGRIGEEERIDREDGGFKSIRAFMKIDDFRDDFGSMNQTTAPIQVRTSTDADEAPDTEPCSIC